MYIFIKLALISMGTSCQHSILVYEIVMQLRLPNVCGGMKKPKFFLKIQVHLCKHDGINGEMLQNSRDAASIAKR